MDLSNLNKDRKQKRKTGMDLSTLVYGKIPPQAKQVEEQVLGIILTVSQFSRDVLTSVFGEIRMVLRPEDFYVEAHGTIYKAMCYLEDNGAIPELTAVIEQLRSEETLEQVGGSYYVSKLTNSAVSHANVLRYCRIIKQYSVARKLIMFSGQIINDAYDGADPLALLGEAEQLFFDINKDIEETRIIPVDKIAFDLLVKILSPNTLTPEELELKYLYTGMYHWDRINGPLFCGGVYVIAARPAMGKTAHIVQLLVNMAKKYPVGLINVEMTDEQLLKRIVSNMEDFDNEIFKKKTEDWTEEERIKFHAGIQKVVKLKLHIESNTTEIDRIIQKIKFWVRKFGVRAVAIDYLQILKVADELAKYMTDVQALNYILEKIRSCAKELNIPIFLLSQLNRELYRRAGNKEPNLGDLKGSGKIEEIAFQISFLHRPEYYDETAVVDEMGETTKGLCYQIVAKHRDGILDRIKHKFLPQYTQFREWTSEITAYVPIVVPGATDGKVEELPF